MNSRTSFYLSMIVSLVVLLVASFIWLTQATPAVAARDLVKPKMVEVALPENFFPRQATPNAGPDLALPSTLPAKQPLLQGSPVITVTKSSVNEDGNPLRPSERITYTISISNSGSVSATNVVVSDTFPANTSFIAGTISITPSLAGGTAGSAATQPVIASGITVTAGSLVTVTYAVLVNSSVANGTQIVNTASITSNEVATPVTSTVIDTVTYEADLSISKTNGQGTTVPGETTTYTIVVSNTTGPSDVTGATVTDNFPATLTGITWTCSSSGGASCSASGSNNISDTVNLPVGGSLTYTATGTVNSSAVGTLANTVSVTVPSGVVDPTPDNNSATDTDTLTPEADIRITKVDSPDPVIAGNTLTYNLTVFNDGPSDATGVVMTDTLPTGVAFTSVVPGQGSCSGTVNVVCNIGTIASSSNITVSIKVNVDPSWSGTLVNVAQVSSNVFDPNTSNDDTIVSTGVQRQADLSVSKTSTPNPVLPEEELTYNITVTNNGPSDASGVTLTDILPGDVTYVSAVPSQGSGCSGTSTVTCNLGSLASGNNATIEIKVTVDSLMMGTLVNTATVSSSTIDPNSSNNTDAENTLVGEFEKVYLPLIIYPGTTELSIHNDNTGGNVTFTVIGAGVSCIVPNNTIQFCGSFPAGTYTVQAIATCGTATTSKTYDPGPVTTKIFCQ